MKLFLGICGAALAVAAVTWQAQASSNEPTARSGGRPPVCCFETHCHQQSGYTKLLQCAGAETTFVLDASNSYDPEGQPLTFEWSSGPGTTIDDVFAPVSLLRIDTSVECERTVPVRVAVSDGTHTVYCRLYIEVVADEPICGPRPTQIECVYTGEDCSASNFSQDPNSVSCDGDPAFAGPVRIRATMSGQPTRVYFDGIVEPGQTFIIDGEGQPGGKVPPDTHIESFDLFGDLLQEVNFHTSCSQPLAVGDQFGSVFLLDFTP